MLSQLNFWSYLPKESESDESYNFKEIIQENEEIENSSENSFKNVTEAEMSRHWAHYLLQVGRSATNIAAKQVTSTAKQIRQNMPDMTIMDQSNIITKFADEQIKFKEEKRLFEKRRRETCLPWMDALNEVDDHEHVLKTNILSISLDERNFLRNSPSGSEFEFNYDLQSPVALSLLKEDPKLASMRYKLVPKRIKEENFWRNYFYRIFLIKQSLETDFKFQDDVVENVPQESLVGSKVCTHLQESEDQVDFVSSEDVSKRELSEEEMHELKREMMKATKNNEDWDAELQKELCEFELINEDTVVMGEDVKSSEYDDIEREIMDELAR